jgi:predicted nucleic acid-binding protein
MMLRAIDLHQKHKISFWAALIVEAARTAGCSNLFSEDLQDGFQIGNMKVKNPF